MLTYLWRCLTGQVVPEAEYCRSGREWSGKNAALGFKLQAAEQRISHLEHVVDLCEQDRQALADERDEARKLCVDLQQANEHLTKLNVQLHQDNEWLAAKIDGTQPRDTPVMAAAFRFDPIANVVEVFNRLFPGKAATIEFVEGLKETEDAWGVTHFPEDGGPPSISLDVDLEYRHVVEILAHELAHVAEPADEDHGERWDAAFSLIHAECCRNAQSSEDTP